MSKHDNNKFNPEYILMQARAANEVNQLAVQAELKSSCILKAYRCGLTLDEYCKRFGVRQTWLSYNLTGVVPDTSAKNRSAL